MAAVAVVASSVATTTILVDAVGASATSCGGCFVSSLSSLQQSSQFCRRNKKSCTSHAHNFDNLLHPLPLPVGSMPVSSIPLAMAKSSNLSLQEQIVQGATMKLLNKEKDVSSTSVSPLKPKQQQRETASIPDGAYSYYVREGLRSGELNLI